MRGLIARFIAGQAPLPPTDPFADARADLDAGIAQRRAARMAREATKRSRRFEHARPKVAQLAAEHARKLREEAGQ